MLNERQRFILDAVLREFIDTAEPVSSNWLSEHLSLDLSPATIRNELKELEKAGFLMHPHVSSGCTPTDQGYRIFVDDFLPELILNFKDSDFFLEAENIDKLLSQVVSEIAKLTKNVAVGISPIKKVYYTGVANLLKQPEFKDAQKSSQIVEILEDLPQLLDLFSQVPLDTKSQVTIGKESSSAKGGSASGGKTGIQECGIIRTFFGPKNFRGVLAVIGPKRMRYDYNQAILNQFAKALESRL